MKGCILVHCEYGFTTNLPLADFLNEDCLFYRRVDGQDRGSREQYEHGGYHMRGDPWTEERFR